MRQQAMSFLAVDVGNTRLKWALYEAAQPGAELLEHGAIFVEHIDSLAEGDWRRLSPHEVLGCNVTGDAVRRRIEEQMESWDASPRWVVPQESAGGVINGYDHPTRLGADRWAAVVGSYWHVTKLMALPPTPVITVMIGTAVTVDAVDAEGHFLGGLILPGHGVMLKALEAATAGLRVPTGEVVEFPTNTSDALTSGGTFAITGAIETMHRRLAERCGVSPVTFMTGGAGWKVSPYLSIQHTLVERLIFDGLLVLQSERASFGVTGF